MYAFSTMADPSLRVLQRPVAASRADDVPVLHIGKSGDLRNFWDRLDVASQNTQR